MKKTLLFSAIMFSVLMSGCLKERSNLPSLDREGGFDFATSKSVTLNVDYGLYQLLDNGTPITGDRNVFEV